MQKTDNSKLRHDYTYHVSKLCKVCKWMRYNPKVRQALVEDVIMFEGLMKLPDFYRKFAVPVPYDSFRMHCYRHISRIEKKIPPMIINEDTPLKKIVGDVTDIVYLPHESILDEFITQFGRDVKDKKYKITVKDGLLAIKMKADIEKGNKDRKKDVLKMMIGANDRPRKATEI